MQRSALCRSRRMLSNKYLLLKFGFDTADNEPCKVCPLSVYRSGFHCYYYYRSGLLLFLLQITDSPGRVAWGMWSGVDCNSSAVGCNKIRLRYSRERALESLPALVVQITQVQRELYSACGVLIPWMMQTSSLDSADWSGEAFPLPEDNNRLNEIFFILA